MKYVMADLHGAFDKYKRMLETIDFREEDDLFVLGDVVDRGPDPVAILRDMAARANVVPITGNHEVMALRVLRPLLAEITAENYATQISPYVMRALTEYLQNGGKTTLDGFRRLSPDDREALASYLEEFLPYEVVKTGGRTFYLVHSGLGAFSPDKAMEDYTLEELAFLRPDYAARPFSDPNTFIICGHTPTLSLTGKAEIYRSGPWINIDCGACFREGRLACLRLDDLAVFYV